MPLFAPVTKANRFAADVRDRTIASIENYIHAWREMLARDMLLWTVIMNTQWLHHLNQEDVNKTSTHSKKQPPLHEDGSSAKISIRAWVNFPRSIRFILRFTFPVSFLLQASNLALFRVNFFKPPLFSIFAFYQVPGGTKNQVPSSSCFTLPRTVSSIWI